MKTEVLLIGGGAALLVYMVYRYQKQVEAGRAAMQPQKGSGDRSATAARLAPPPALTQSEIEYNRYMQSREKG